MKKTLSISAIVSFTLFFISAGGGRTEVPRGPQGTPALQSSQNTKIDADYGKMPLYFIPNQGQMDKHVSYYVQGKDKTLYFTAEGVTFALIKPTEQNLKSRKTGLDQSEASTAERWAVKLEFIGADKSVKPLGEAETGAIVSYFKGRPEDWRRGLPTYSKIIYPNLWPGIDLVYYGTANRLKYEFIVHPGADPSRIRLAYQGAESVSVDGEGRLNVTTPVGGFADDVPVAYQEMGGRRVDIKLAYKLDGSPNPLNQVAIADRALLNYEIETGLSGAAKDGAIAGLIKLDGARGGLGKKPCLYGFEVGDYDRSLPLVLDPAILVYCGYIGGSGDEEGLGIAVDGSGSAYVTGYTSSTEATFPAAAGPDLTYNGGTYDAFVAKVSASGGLAYCGYIGGFNQDLGMGIAVDGSGNAYITGSTSSTQATFPVAVGPDLTQNGQNDAFVAKVNASGTALVYCGYIGGSSGDEGLGIAVDGAGNAYVTGQTISNQLTFPVVVGPDLTYNDASGLPDAFVAKVNAAGTALVYCGYIGGDQEDHALGIAVDGSGNACMTGYTRSTEATFPVLGGPDLTYNDTGWGDAFVAKVNASGTALVYCGYIGGSKNDEGRRIAVDGSGNAYVTGNTMSTEATFPVKVGPDLTFNDTSGFYDAFVAKVSASGALVYCGYIGGSTNDYGYGIAVDGSGNAHVTGVTASTETTFPVTVGPDLTFNDAAGHYDAFAAKVNASGMALVYCGYIGGSGTDYGLGVALDGSGSAYVTGFTSSTPATFPVMAGPDLTYNGGTYDVFVAKISYWEPWAAKHAVGDFDGDGAKEVAVDFGANGIYLYNNSGWTQLSSLNPESLLAADVDGDNVDEIVADMGATGLWLWNGGVWNQLSGVNVETLAAGDVDGDGADEIEGDFGAVGLWLYNGGVWTQLSGVNADYVTTANVDGTGGDEIIGDFGTTGVWIWNAGAWTVLSGVNADYVTSGRMTGGGRFLMGDFGPTGMWIWSVLGGWTELSGVNADYMIAANTDADPEDEIVGDFGATGLWLYNSGAWTILSGVNADSMIRAEVDGDGQDEIAVDFGSIGLWLWNAGSWTQISGVNPEYLLAADVDGDNKDEIMVDFGSLGAWLWNEGSWSQISGNNPD
jgi:hypothetical protein